MLYTARDGQSASEYRTGSREDLRIDLNRRTSGSALVIPTGG
ncbi:hypothetical protein [Coralloluteibacterium stylophorae]|nr:hypothetical protein [Coralloluteibacterium stylophorae]